MRSIVSLAICLAVATSFRGQTPPTTDSFTTGQFDTGIAAVTLFLKANPNDDQARLALGSMQFIRGIERFGQSMYRHGLMAGNPLLREVPFIRLPIPENKQPEKISYAQMRAIIQALHADLTAAEATLAAIKADDVKLVLPVGAIKLDFTGTGKDGESLSRIVERFMGARAIPDNWTVAFDRGDAIWMRGYCHLLLAIIDFALAHDGKELFDRTAHVAFPFVESPYAAFAPPVQERRFDYESIVDAIAFVHLIRLNVVDKAKMESSLAHLDTCLELSAEMWRHILAETDDDREWIPNPKQQGALGIPVTADMIASWKDFTTEARELLAGKKRIPFWRNDKQGRGVNLRKAFTEPTTFDLVLWIQGSAALPYLEKGPMTDQATWQRLMRVFQGNFWGMAMWFN